MSYKIGVGAEHAFSFAPGTVIGYWRNGKPICQIAGGAPKDDEFDSDMGGDEGTEDTEEEDAEEEENEEETEEPKTEKKDEPKAKKNPLEEENERLKQRLAKARQESARRRKKIEELTKPGSEQKTGEDSEAAVADARTAGYAEAEGKFKPILHKVAGKAALMEAGVKPNKAKRALRLIDWDDVEIDDEGEISGLEDAIEDLKDEWPELFVVEKEEEDEPQQPKVRVKSSQVNGANRSTSNKKPQSATEIALARLTGRR